MTVEARRLYPGDGPEPRYVTSLEWDMDDDGTFEIAAGQSTTAQRKYDQPGIVGVRGRLTNSHGEGVTRTKSFLVRRRPEPPPNESPLASFTAVPNPAMLGQTVNFDASASSDDGRIVAYRWDLDGDGTVDTATEGPRTTRVYTTSGNVRVTLEVVDDDGVSWLAGAGASPGRSGWSGPPGRPPGSTARARSASCRRATAASGSA